MQTQILISFKRFESLEFNKNKVTRSEGTAESCLDHIFLKTNKSLDPIYSTVIETKITDHYPIMLTITGNKFKNHQPRYNIIEKIQYDKLIEQIKNEKWMSVLECSDPNLSLDNFLKKLNHYITNNTSIKCHKKESNIIPIKPWITPGIVKCIRFRDKLFKNTNKKIKLLNIYNLASSSGLWNYYKSYRNLLNKIIKDAKINYFKSQFQEAGNDIKRKWNVINKICDRSKNREHINKIVYNNIEITSPELLSKTFNEHFSSIGTNLASKIKNNKNRSSRPTNNNRNLFNKPLLPHSIFLDPIDELEVSSYINELKTNSTTGIDNLNVKTLKTIKSLIAVPLTHIFNQSFKSAIFPDAFKKAILIPIHKGGDAFNLNNYRPISLLPHLAKILEKCVKKRFMDFFLKFKIISKNQFGFQKNISTDNAIYELTSQIYNNLDNSKKTLAIFLDLMKAFDTVQHDKLLDKLHSCGIRGRALKLMESYLSGRTQCTRVGNIKSSECEVVTGVPQGTVLGPILFLIYINDLCNLNINNMRLISYADDTVLIFSSNNWQETFTSAREGLWNIFLWLSEYSLTLNSDKTQYVTFSSTQSSQPPPSMHICLKENSCTDRTCNNVQIMKTHNSKYLGIIIDDKLTWAMHAQHLSDKLRKCFYVYHRLRNILDTNNCLKIFDSLTQSLIQYGIIGWGGIVDAHLKPVQLAQKHALKIILNKPFTYPTYLTYNDSKVLDCRQLYIKTLFTFYFKYPIFISPTNFSTYQLRNTYKSLFCNKKIGQRQAKYMFSKFDKILPESVKTSSTLRSFKRNMKLWLFDENVRNLCSQLLNKNIWEINH
jgi:hypothetical protein